MEGAYQIAREGPGCPAETRPALSMVEYANIGAQNAYANSWSVLSTNAGLANMAMDDPHRRLLDDYPAVMVGPAFCSPFHYRLIGAF